MQTMLKSVRDRRESEEGFTLIELMVVVLIIAILIAIAIPTFLGARQRANDRAAQSSLRNALTAVAPVFDNTLKIVDDMMKPATTYREMGDPLINPEDWWKRLDLPIRGYNSSRGISNV